MGDLLQFILVTTAAAVALGVIVRPFFRRPSASSMPCARCAIGKSRGSVGSLEALTLTARARSR